MARWKMASHMAIAIRDAEKHAEDTRILHEQQVETKHNVNVLRKLARNRAKLNLSASIVLAQGRRLHDVLLKENLNEKLNAHVAGSPYYQRQDAQNHELLLDNLRKQDQAHDEAKKLKEALHIIRNETQAVEREHMDVRKKLNTLVKQLHNVHVINPNKVTRHIELMEQKYGLQLTENRRLRDMVDHLQGQWRRVMQLHDSLDKELADLSKQLGNDTETAKTMYEDRDSHKRNIQKLMEHLTKSTASYKSEMQLLQFRIDVLKRVERFMTTKNKFRKDESRERREMLKSQPSMIERDTADFSGLMTRIKKEMQEDDLLTIINTFMELEMENYMLFKNITETHDLCTNLQLETEEIREKSKKLKEDKITREQETMARKVELVEKIEHCKQTAEKTEGFVASADNVIRVYTRGILAIMEKLGYNNDDIIKMSGVYKGVEERNIDCFLAEIERYVNGLFDIKAASDYISWDEARKKTMTTVRPEPLSPRLSLVTRVVVVPPMHEDTTDVDDLVLPLEAAFKPLNSSEIRYRVEEDLEAQGPEDLPFPSMKDPTSDAVGDTPHSPTHRISMSVDVL